MRDEVRILLHLAGKVAPAKVDDRPTPKQRTTLELLRYLAIMGPIHLRAVLADRFDMEAWRNTWKEGETAAGAMLVSLVLSHYAAYRMQLFLYLKASGGDDLNTMNLRAGMDAGESSLQNNAAIGLNLTGTSTGRDSRGQRQFLILPGPQAGEPEDADLRTPTAPGRRRAVHARITGFSAGR